MSFLLNDSDGWKVGRIIRKGTILCKEADHLKGENAMNYDEMTTEFLANLKTENERLEEECKLKTAAERAANNEKLEDNTH